MSYEAKRTSEKKAISLAKKLLAGTGALVDEHRHLFNPYCLNHTDIEKLLESFDPKLT